MTHDADTPLPRGLHVSITQLSEETGKTRETVSRKLAAANVAPSGEVRKQAVYRLRDALRVLYMGLDDGSIDPDKLDPHSRHAHYKAEREKQSLATDAGELIPREAYRDEVARVAKLFSQALDAIPDLLERDCALTPDQVLRVQGELDKLRESLAGDLAEDESPDGDSAAVRESPSGDAGGQRDHPAAPPDVAERGRDAFLAM
jgi:hypothetical protein